MYTGIHLDVAWESYSFDLFDMPLDISLEYKKAGLCIAHIPVDSFDLMCESVTYVYILTKYILTTYASYMFTYLFKCMEEPAFGSPPPSRKYTPIN